MNTICKYASYATAMVLGKKTPVEKKKMTVEEILANWPCIEEVQEYYEPCPPAYLGNKKNFGCSYDWKFEEVEWIPEDDPEYQEYNFDEAMQSLIEQDIPGQWQLKQFYKLLREQRDEKIDELIELCKISVDYVPTARSRNMALLQRMRVLLQLFRMTRYKCRTRLLLSTIDDWQYIRHLNSSQVYAWRNYRYTVGDDTNKITDMCDDIIRHRLSCPNEADVLPQSGEEEAIGTEQITTASASNVVLSTAREPSVANIFQPTIRWSKYVAGDVIGSYKEVTDRWLTLGAFTWTTDQRTSQIIYKTTYKKNNMPFERNPILPLDAVYYSGSQPCDMPNLIPFKVHTYWRGNMEIKIQVNSNKFQIGQLMCTFYYQPHLNDNIADKKNIYSVSQMDSVIIQASASNEAILKVNYNHMYPMLPTRRVPTVNDDEPILNMGELWIMVQNQLATTALGPKKCVGSVLVRFTDSEFAGMCYGGFSAVPQAGVTSLVKAAESVLTNVIGNMDAPTNTQSSMYVVPTASHNWSAGRNVAEQLHVLRLDPTGQTFHQNTNNETSIKSIVNKYGLIDILQWPIESQPNGKRGSILRQFPAAPDTLFDKQGQAELSNYVTPPIGIVSSMFHQWRGSLEYKIQFVASQFHTGRILVAYIPGYVSGALSIREVKASPHVIFDLQEQREFSYIVPYIAYKPWWTRQQSGNYLPANSPAPSNLVIMVYNELVAMESIVPYVYINIYLRAGPDFEVAIPVQPSISLTWYKDFVYPNEDEIGAVNGYFPYYYGFWKGLNNSNTLMARWGSAVDQTAEFPDDGVELQNGEYMWYTAHQNLLTTYPTAVKQGKSQTPLYAIIKQSGHGYAILIPFNNQLNCKRAAYDIYVKGKSLSDPTVTQYMLNAPTYEAGSYSTGNPRWVRRISDQPLKHEHEEIALMDLDHFAIPQSNEDDTALAITTGPMLLSFGNGMQYYGESFVDLKDLARRYCMYAQVQLASLIKQDINKCTFTFHALPQGIKPAIGVPADPNELFNRCREGPIALISSLFRYYRGSLRFKICMPPELEAKVWIQHRPDRLYNPKENNVVQLCHKIDTAQGVFNHGYAYYVQYTNINGIIEFEVPYYNNTAYNLLQLPSAQMNPIDQWGVSLGQVNVGLEWIGDINVHQGKWISIYYALGDDMSFTQWVGGSRFLKLDDNITAVPQALDDEELIFDATLLTPEERLEEQISSQWGWKSPMATMTEAVSDTARNVINENVQTVKDELSIIADKITTQVSDVASQTDKPTIAAMIGNLLHVVVNPTLSTVVTSIINILISIGVVAVTALTGAFEIIKSFLSKLGFNDSATKPQDTHVVEGEPQASDLDEETASWCSLLYNGIATAMNVSIKRPKTWTQWQDVMTKDLSNNTRGANQIFIFLRNTMNCIRKILDYILCRSNKDYKLLKLVESSPECIKAWCKEVLYLIDPAIRRDSIGNATFADRVYDAQVFGQLLITDMSYELRTEKNTSLISKLYDKITLLKDDLLEIGEHPHVRKLPFTIYVYGEPGIGKSQLSTSLCCRLLKAYKYTTKKGLKCTLNPQSDYWDQCDHQPVLEIDDLWAVSLPGALEKQLLTLFQVVSPVVLSPPKAALEEKKMRYNPEIFYINSNKDFPVYNDVNSQAIWRRRDVLVKAQRSSRTIPGCPHCFNGLSIDKVEPRWLEDFHHLDFYLALDVKNANTTYDGPYRYDEFVEKLTQMFLANRKRETVMFNRRVMEHEFLQLKEDDDEEYKSMSEKFAALQEKRYIEYKLIHERTLKTDMDSLKDEIKRQAMRVKDSIKAFSINKAWHSLTDNYEIKENDKVKKIEPFTDILEARKNKITKYLEDSIAEFQAGEDAFASTSQMLCDDMQEAKMYKEEQPDVEILRDFVKEDIYTLEDVKTINEYRERLHDDGVSINSFLSYYRVLIVKIKDINLKKINSLEKTIDFINAHGLHHKSEQYCQHVIDLHHDCVLTGNKIFATFRSVDINLCEPCEGRCIMNSPYLKYLWYRRWLYSNPTHRLAYSQGKRAHLPDYFNKEDIYKFITPDSFLKNLYHTLKLQYEAHISPIISKMIWWVKKLWPKITSALLAFGIFTAVAAPVYGASFALGNIQKTQQELVAVSATNSWDSRVSQDGFARWTQLNPSIPQSYDAGNVKITANPKSAGPYKVTPQASQQCDVVERLVKANTVMVRFYYGETCDTFRCLVIRGRQMLMLRHYIEMVHAKKDRITKVTLYYDFNNDKLTNGCEVDFDFWSLTQTVFMGEIDKNVYESNYVIVELPPHIPDFKSLVNFMCPISSWSSIGRTGNLIIGAKDVVREIPITWVDHQPTTIRSKGPTNQVIMGKCFRYGVEGAGMCGSILLATNLQKPIIGMHVAGVTGPKGFGIAEPLYADMFVSAPALPERPQTHIIEPTLLDIDESDVNLGGLLYRVGTVESKDAQHQSAKTRIRPSLIQGVFPINTEPNPLSIKDPRLPLSDLTPLEHGCTKHGLKNKQLPDKLIRLAEDHLRNKILSKVKPIRAKVGKLTEQDAICGIPSIPEYTALSFSTSAGFPLSSYKPRDSTGKKFLFNLKEEEQGYKLESLHPELRKYLDVTHQMRQRNLKPMTVFTDCLKDTTLTKEKCRVLGKTRVFSISPVQYTIHFRQYIGDFMAAYRRARFDANHAIGININSTEWTDLAGRLQAKGPKIMTGDYSNYGPSLNAELVEAVIRIIVDWHRMYWIDSTDEDLRMVAMLLQELLCAYHLCGDLVYRVPCGVPSGSPITDILNSLVGNLYLYIAWLDITGKSLNEYEEHCYEVVYGDDVIQNISDEIYPIYNTESLGAFFQKYLIKFTDVDKQGNICKYHDLIDDATFLKHKFKPHPFRPYTMLAAIDPISAEGCANWISCAKVDDPALLTKQNCVMSCQLMYGHGPEVFNKHRDIVLRALQQAGLFQPIPTWNDLDRMFFETPTTSSKNYNIEGYYIIP